MTAFLLFGCAFDAALVLALSLMLNDAVRRERTPRALRRLLREPSAAYGGPERRHAPRFPPVAHAA